MGKRKITFDYSNALDFIDKKELYSYKEKVALCHRKIHVKTSETSELLGWVDVENYYKSEEYKKIKIASEKIRSKSDVFIVIGVGGSYLGGRAAIEMLNHNFYNELPREKRKGPKIYFIGHNLNANYIKDLIEIIDGQDISINIISKSGTTLEPAIAFRILKDYMEKKYGKKEARKRIYVTSDKNKGLLKELAKKEAYKTFTIADNIGGRYSVLTSVGLLPMAVAGINIDQLMEGAENASGDLNNEFLESNPSYQYAVSRNILDLKKKNTEILVTYEANLYYFSEWFKQLFGESEGKEGKGIFPTSLTYTKDLHSIGQYIQDGRKNLFQTILNIEESREDIIIKATNDNLDGLNYLEGKTLNYVNYQLP